MTGWVRAEPDVSTGIDWGGDVQVGETYDARWSRTLDDGLTAMVSRNYYAIQVRENGPRELEQCDEFIACADPSDPGGTEKWSELRYQQVYAYSPTDLGARAAAYGAEAPCDDEWNQNAPEWLQVDGSADDDADGC